MLRPSIKISELLPRFPSQAAAAEMSHGPRARLPMSQKKSYLPGLGVVNTGIDVLAIHDLLVTKGRLHKVRSPIAKVYSDVGLIVRENTVRVD
jgi:hypothetical protein